MVMQITLSEVIGFFGIIVSIATGVWVIIDRFGSLEGRVVRLEEKVTVIEEKIDEILVYFKHKRKKHSYRKH
jgi:uncharacterized protein (UPF0548 family)